jgi:hypothetical protein
MPYIKKEDRLKFNNKVIEISNLITCDGDLNYIISLLLHKQLEKRGVCYQNMNNLIGSIECAKNEFLRTVVAPYEDKKRNENGSVSELDVVVKNQLKPSPSIDDSFIYNQNDTL